MYGLIFPTIFTEEIDGWNHLGLVFWSFWVIIGRRIGQIIEVMDCDESWLDRWSSEKRNLL